MPLTPEEQLELDSLESEAGTVAQSGLSIAEQQELDSLNSEGGISESPVFDEKTAGQIYDASVDAQIPIPEAENIFSVTDPSSLPVSDGIASRLGKQFYNSTVANVVTTVGAKSELGKIRTDLNSLAILEGDFKKRLESGLPVTEHEIEYYAKPYDRWTIGSIFGTKQPDWKVKAWEDYQSGKLNIGKTPNPQEAMKQFVDVQKEAERKTFEQTDISMPVSEPTGVSDKIVDAAAGIAGFATQVAILKKASPSMPEWLVWENVNRANGGTPGGGAAMQLSLGGLNQAIPGTGFIPAVERGTAASALFGTTTYLGGGDTTDVLIGAGIPFAFEGMGLTRQTWANYKNKKAMIQTIKEKAPALKDKPDIEIDKSITFLLTNIEPAKTGANLLTKGEMEKQFSSETPTKPLQDLSAEVKDYMRRRRYDELLEKAKTGDKKAIQELNDSMRSVPTYDELLERGFAGDAKAFDLLNSGQYREVSSRSDMTPQPKGTPDAEVQVQGKAEAQGQVAQVSEPTATGAQPKAPAPAAEPVVDPTEPKTPIQKIREQATFAANADTKPGTVAPEEMKKARERGFITSAKEVLPELRIEGQYIPRPTDPLAIKARNLVLDDIIEAEKLARSGMNDKAVDTASELIKYYGDQARQAKSVAAADALYEKAAAVASDVAVTLTEAGRTVQAASILGRMTPEGQLRFAAREIQRYNEEISKQRGGLGGPQNRPNTFWMKCPKYQKCQRVKRSICASKNYRIKSANLCLPRYTKRLSRFGKRAF
jgi:hypothetical protein